MFRFLLGTLGAVALALPAAAQVHPFPASFRTQNIQTEGATLHVRVGGQGPAVVLLHGFGDTGDMWAPLAANLARDHTVVVPDLRGMGLSSRPAGGYDKRTQAADIRSVLTTLGIDRAAVVGHDIGTMVAYAYAARYPEKTEKLVVMDAPVPRGESREPVRPSRRASRSFRGSAPHRRRRPSCRCRDGRPQPGRGRAPRSEERRVGKEC